MKPSKYNSKLAKALKLTYFFILLVGLLKLLLHILQGWLIQQFDYTESELAMVRAAGGWAWAMGLVLGFLVMISFFLFITWFNRAYSNLSEKTNLRENNDSTFIYWIIPFLNLYKSFEMMKEYAWKSAKVLNAHENNSVKPPAPWKLFMWWMAFWLLLLLRTVGLDKGGFSYEIFAIRQSMNSNLFASSMTLVLTVVLLICFGIFQKLDKRIGQQVEGRPAN